jgi:serine/threonine protein phosphatase PrpC
VEAPATGEEPAVVPVAEAAPSEQAAEVEESPSAGEPGAPLAEAAGEPSAADILPAGEEAPAVEEPPPADEPAPSADERASAGAKAQPATEEEAAGDDEEEFPEIDDDLLGFWREEGEPLRPVEVGSLLDDRYQVMEALDVQPDAILYRAQDLIQCWQCGYEGNTRGDAFCARCGAAQDRRPHPHLLQVRQGTDLSAVILPEGEEIVRELVHEGRVFLLLAGPGATPRDEAAQVWGIRLLVGHRSDTGQVRELDEDSLFVLSMAPSYEARVGPVVGLFAVADGMGGHEGGEIASKMALQVLAAQAMRHVLLPTMAGELVLDEDVAALLRKATIAANDAVFLARQKRDNDMGTTLTTALVREERLFLAHVGDCRAYRWNAEGLQQLTTDHSVVASMIAEGRAAPEEIYSHPHRSVIYRCVGDKPTVEVDTDMLPLAPGDRVILCSDGLWEMVRSEGIEDVMLQEPDPQAACDLLVKHANLAGGEDNISVIVVQVETM